MNNIELVCAVQVPKGVYSDLLNVSYVVPQPDAVKAVKILKANNIKLIQNRGTSAAPTHVIGFNEDGDEALICQGGN